MLFISQAYPNISLFYYLIFQIFLKFHGFFVSIILFLPLIANKFIMFIQAHEFFKFNYNFLSSKNQANCLIFHFILLILEAHNLLQLFSFYLHHFTLKKNIFIYKKSH